MSHSSPSGLLFQRRFSCFFVSQLCGVLTDNIFKNFVVLLLTYQAAQWTTLSPGLLTNIAAGLFILPFVLFSATAGQLADKYDKSIVMQVIKAAEIGITLFAVAGFYFHSLPLLLSVIFLLGTHSAWYGPVKYALLPRILSEAELTGGNGLVEMGTFLGILVGTLAAGAAAAEGVTGVKVALGLVVIAVVGFLFSRGIPRTGSAAPDLRVDYSLFRPTLEVLKDGRERNSVWLCILGISWFWFFGALLLSQLPGLAKNSLQGTESLVTWLLAVFSVGVAVGSMLTDKLSGGRVEIGLVPFGSLGLSLFAGDIYFAAASFSHHGLPLRVMADLFFVGFFGGLYIVPLYAFIQSRADRAKQSRIIAANNIVNSLFMVVSAAMCAGLLFAGVSVPGLILVGAVLNLAVAGYIYKLLPEFLWRFVDWLVVHSAYHVKVKNPENIPENGAALLVSNHVSFADALILAAAIPRPVRFVMDQQIFSTPIVNWLFKAAKAIPIASAKDFPEVYASAFQQIEKALADGELVLLFPEGAITRDGTMKEFKAGYLKILEASPVPLIPMAVSGLDGSIFSRTAKSRGLFSILQEVWRPISVSVGKPIIEERLQPEELRSRVTELLT